MNIVLDHNQFNIENVHFMEKKKNIIIEGFFTKIIYFDQFVTLNAIYIQFPIQYNEKIINNYIFFNPLNNMGLIKKIAQIEEEIANYFREEFNITKPIVLALYNQLYSGKIKVFKDYNRENNSSHSRFVLKISGIWENHREVGIAYKFLEMFYV
jgi:hypothetical protein